MRPGPVAISAELASWHSVGTSRWRASVPVGSTQAGFVQVTARAGLGIAFTNQVSEAAALNNQILENGAGVALGDVDGDGFCDVYLCGSEPANALYRNLGDWHFTNITDSAGIACAGQFSTGAALADIDGDADLDLLVNGLGVGTRLFRNDGQGHFTEATASGLVRRHGATSLALNDADGDGDLDLYVTTYRVTSARAEVPPPRVEVRRQQGQLVVSPADRFLAFPLSDGNVELAEKGEADHFYLNDGHGTFREVPWNSGMFLDEAGRPLAASPEDWGLSVLFRDLTGDGLPDLYVCNDFFRSRDQFWIQDGQGHFRAASTSVWRNLSLSSMAADAADLDRDGNDDLFVAEMLSLDHPTRHRQRANAFRPEQALPFSDPSYRPELPRNTLFLGRGDGSFAEIAQYAGLAASDWSWNVAFLDIDLDGFEDVLVATGNAHDVLDLDAQNALDGARARAQGPTESLAFYPPLPQRPVAFRNQGDLTFRNVSITWGLTNSGIAQGIALGDLDNDGDLDVVMNRLHDAALLLRNDAPAPRVAVKLRGLAPNTSGIGAKIRLLGGSVPQSQQILAGGRYLSSDEALRTFAAPAHATGLQLEVTWRSGRQTRVPEVQANRVYEVFESAESERPSPSPTTVPPAPLFTNVSARLAHRHLNPSPPDFHRQPLLPRALNQLGPGVTWLDWDGDGWDDLALGGGPGQALGLFRNVQGTQFIAVNPIAGRPSPISQDTLGLVPWHRSSSTVLLSADSPDMPELTPNPSPSHSISLIDVAQGTAVGLIKTASSVPGPIALADVDQDGDLDAFVGGRHVPGRFPTTATSQLCLNQAGTLVADPTVDVALRQAGLVSGATFTDLDGDGNPDLVLACEWGPIRVFRNRNGRLTEATQALALDSWTGCWAGVASGDFDEDGRPDLIASNLGRNTHRAIPGPAVWRLYSHDFDDDGILEIIETYRPSGGAAFLPWRTRDVLGKAVPRWQTEFPTYRSFGSATVDSLLASQDTPSFFVEARTLEHRLFLNRGDRFESRPLPAEAQFAPGFGIGISDFDGDGHLDVFLAQNAFDFDLDSGRADAGVGLCLLGNGRGGLRPLSTKESGIALYGAQRGAAVADFDQDGRPDLVVTQNNGPTALFRNSGGTPGTRIRLQGPAGNPEAIGASIRRVLQGQPIGPVREVQVGSGYLSGDSTTVVLPRLTQPSELEVRWPDGRTRRRNIPAGAVAVNLSP